MRGWIALSGLRGRWRSSKLERTWEVDTLKLDQVEVKSYVGGLVKSFERKAV
jgi:hypothetical protein